MAFGAFPASDFAPNDGVSWAPGLQIAVALVLLTLLAGGVLVVGAGLRARAPVTDDAPPSPFSIAAFALLFGIGVWKTLHFRFVEDDFLRLIVAVDRPWDVDQTLRLVSTTMLFRAGVLVGGLRVFIAANLAVYAVSALALHALLRRAGEGRSEALLAVALFAVGPGFFDNLRLGDGFQTTAAIALIHMVLLLVDEAARSHDDTLRRAGLSTLAAGLVGLGVFVKYSMMGVVPVLAWIWGTRVVRGVKGPPARAPFYGILVAGVAVPLLLAHAPSTHAGELEKAGFTRIGWNLVDACRHLSLPLARVVLAVAILIAGAWVLRRLDVARSGTKASAAHEPAPDLIRRALRDTPPAFLALAAVSLAPFLFNIRYFAAYYVVPCLAWLYPVPARVLHLAWRRLPAFAALLAALAVALLVPYDLVWGPADAEVDHVGVMLASLGRATAGRPAPCRVLIEPDCASLDEVAGATEELAQMCLRSEGGMGVRWATGWHDVVVSVPLPRPVQGLPPEDLAARTMTLRTCPADRAPELRVGYCRGEMRVK